jgi:hypothetical protein
LNHLLNYSLPELPSETLTKIARLYASYGKLFCDLAGVGIGAVASDRRNHRGGAFRKAREMLRHDRAHFGLAEKLPE